jgi:hypothetical protein
MPSEKIVGPPFFFTSTTLVRGSRLSFPSRISAFSRRPVFLTDNACKANRALLSNFAVKVAIGFRLPLDERPEKRIVANPVASNF